MKRVNGIGVSPGISIGRAFVIERKTMALTGILLQGEAEKKDEIEKFAHAVKASIEEVEGLKARAEAAREREGIDILETHIELLGDPQIEGDVTVKINEEGKTAQDAVIEVIGSVVQLFKDMDDEYMSGRAADVEDIGNRILKHLQDMSETAGSANMVSGISGAGGDRPAVSKPGGFPQQFEEDTILIAEDLAPSDTVSMDIKKVTGFATQTGGKTSHASIVAKSRGIPAVAGCGGELRTIVSNDTIILDGLEGVVIVNPGPELLDAYLAKREAYRQNGLLLLSLKDIPAVTRDGTSVKMLANISGPEDMEEVFGQGGEGVGLFRTELLFMGRDSFPTEEEQFGFYKKTALQSRQKPIIIRTLDIGGDKQWPYLGLPKEQNPFLGYRAIRICLDRKDLFLTQLRAILRAGVFGDFRLMFPMISSVQEIRRAKQVVAEAKAGLVAEGIPYVENMPVGIMIEIPSAAVTADLLAKEVDFFSIGTNDLCQYTLAVDRMNEKIRDLYDPFNPGVLRLIRYVIEQGRQHNVHVGMCGEMASDPLATLLLLGMGLEEFSMGPSSIPAIKNILVHNSVEAAKVICKEVMEMDSSQKIQAYLKAHLQEIRK
ncbi:MAG: phosphoenolpyruvate--protein phosphotransferase [Puia sp.]|nr:phosphoenolpyruvate--protein phosphotransferase [Puia sp.]